VSDPSPRVTRLATARWLDVRLLLGVVLVLLAVVAGARVFAAAGRSTPVYLARHALVPGERLRAGDLSVGRVRLNGHGGSYVAASIAAPDGYVVTRYVGPGELLPLAAVSATTPAAQQSRLVTLPVVAGHLPENLARGDLVDVYVTAKTVTGGVAPAPVRVLAGVAVDSYDSGAGGLSGSSTGNLSLVVRGDDVASTVRAVETGSIDVVRVPAASVAGTAP
jgi:hypothetical protein